MTVALAGHQPVRRRPIPSRPPATSLGDVACWSVFAVAAVLFVLDATVTIQALAAEPLAVEQNPIARWTLDAHPMAPYVLKGAVVAGCGVVVAMVRSMDEGWAAYVVSLSMAGAGLLGVASALAAIGA